MNTIDGSKIDLNLLTVLHVLLTEGSVTRAAKKLGVGQSATSHALTRLRELFQDPLFVRVGRQIVPTPRAQALAEPLKRLLNETTRLVRHETTWNPAETTRAFTLVCPDLLAPMLPALVQALQSQAPKARLEVNTPSPNDHRALEEGQLDLTLAPTPEHGPGLILRSLGKLHFGIITRQNHPLATTNTLSRKTWSAYPHVLVRTGHGGKNIAGEELQRAHMQRQIGLIVPTFLAALWTVAETNLLFTAPRELVAPLTTRLHLQILNPPIPMPEIPVSAIWHERFHHDNASRFFRELVLKLVNDTLNRERERE